MKHDQKWQWEGGRGEARKSIVLNVLVPKLSLRRGHLDEFAATSFVRQTEGVPRAKARAGAKLPEG